MRKTLLYYLVLIFGWLLVGCDAREEKQAAPQTVIEQTESTSNNVDVKVGVGGGAGGYFYDPAHSVYVWRGPYKGATSPPPIHCGPVRPPLRVPPHEGHGSLCDPHPRPVPIHPRP